MSERRKRYFRNNDEEDDRFETEAFSHLNEEENEDSTPENEQESGNEDSEPEDVQERPWTESDDEAPDDVGFHDSRQSALSQLRSAMRQVESEKQKKKTKRQQLDAQFKEQKAKKQKELASAKLPEDILEEIEDSIPKKVQKTEGKRYPDGRKRRKSHKKLKGSVAVENVAVQPSQPDRQSIDYIAFTDSASGVEVSDMRFLEKQSKTMAQLAADFKQNRLYGKNVKRESNQKILAKKEKRRQRRR